MATENMTSAIELLSFIKSGRIVLATVESCTGGLIANQITDIAGASSNFWGGWTVYDSAAKQGLGVSAELIQKKNAVSPEVAQSMAEHGLERLTAALTSRDPKTSSIVHPWSRLAVISTTGIAGPDGGTPERPVGRCFIGVAISGCAPKVFEVRTSSETSRIECKEFFAREAMTHLLSELRKSATSSNRG